MMASLDKYYLVSPDTCDSQPKAASRKVIVGAAAIVAGSCFLLFSTIIASTPSHTLRGGIAMEFITRAGWSPSLRSPKLGNGPTPILPVVHAEGKDTSQSLKLCYFDIRGVAETSRILFALSKKPYEDKRFEITWGTPGNFSTIMRPEFDAAKAAGELDVSLGKVPYLEVNGQKVGQSKAIERYLAKQFGMFGESDFEGAVIDQLCEHVIDFKNSYQRVRGFGPIGDDEAKKAALAKWFSEDLPNNMKLFEKSLPACEEGPFLIGKKVSLADVCLYQFCAAPGGNFDNQFTQKAEEAKASFQDCPRIKAAMEAIGEIPELQAYISTRPARGF